MSLQPTLGLGFHEGNDQPERIKFPLDSFKDKGYLTHNYHPYPAKFVPQIPRNVILELSHKGDVVLDPFCGSGTSLVEATILGRKAIGSDLNTLACLISRVKTTPLNDNQLAVASDVIRQVNETQHTIELGEHTLFNDQDLPEFLNRDHWFQPHVLKELALLKKALWSCEDRAVSNFLKVAFSAIIVKVSNQDSDTRWKAVQKNVPPGSACKAFVTKASDMVERMNLYTASNPAQSEVFQQSITDEFPLRDDSIDLVITSPPYPNSYDYYLYHKLRFFWLGFDHYAVQEREVGSRNKHSDNGHGIEIFSESMITALRSLYRVLRPGKFLCVVIGDAILKGSVIDMNHLFRQYGESAGFSFACDFSFDQRKYSTSFTRNLKSAFKRSHIMFFKKK